MSSASEAGGEEKASPLAKRQKRAAAPKERIKCPYLDTVKRQVLDFDFEKLCSVCLSNQNVYCCLVCGVFFSGRGAHTYAYTHANQQGHFVFINLGSSKVYCLPGEARGEPGEGAEASHEGAARGRLFVSAAVERWSGWSGEA